MRKFILVSFILWAGILSLGAQSPQTHRVESGQTLWSIARLYNIPVQELMALNQMTNPQIRPGQVLVIGGTPSGFQVDLSPQTYKVESGDSLSHIALKYGTSVEELMRLNGLKDENLRAGQKLVLRSLAGTQTYRVQAGDSLSVLAQRFGVSQEDLLAINHLSNKRLQVGQMLRVYKPREVPLTHEVLEMDTLPGLAALYGIPAAQLKELNQLASDRLAPGSVLKLRGYQTAGSVAAFSGPQTEQKPNTTGVQAPSMVAFPDETPVQSSVYVVKSGDSLYKVARTFGISPAQLKQMNQLTSEGLKVGQKLQVPAAAGNLNTSAPKESIPFPGETSAAKPRQTSGVFPEYEEKYRETLTWDTLVVLNRDIPLFEWNNDYYYWSHPGEASQPSSAYSETPWSKPLEAYKKASQLFKAFEAMVEKRPLKSQTLAGYTVVLDPGHGGMDPGAIVKTTDGNGDTLFITEDEYVYDIAMRMYILLKEHGAQVQLTTLSPNHLVRDTTPATRTLINEKNEVYNDLALNQGNRGEDWVAGGQIGLDKRLQIVSKFFQKAPEGKRIFISLHADNSPKAPMGTGIFVSESTKGVDTQSQKAAEKLLPFLGKDSYIRTENLAVLRNNPADLKFLIEVRNVAFPDHSWALRLANARQLDAQKIVRGLLETLK